MEIDIREDSFFAPWIRCEVDGTDVSERCFAANEQEGWALCYVMLDKNRFAVDGARNPQEEKLTGTVTLSLLASAPEHVRDEYIKRL